MNEDFFYSGYISGGAGKLGFQKILGILDFVAWNIQTVSKKSRQQAQLPSGDLNLDSMQPHRDQ